MTNITNALIFFAFVVASHVAADNSRGVLHVVNQSQFPMAAAIDGTPPVFYVRPATSATAAKSWVFYMDGGDFCGYGESEAEQLQDCYARSKTDLGSSRSYLKQHYFNMDDCSPLFNSATSAPMHDWNWIFIPYLDGGYYAGTREDTPIVNDSKLYFRGAFNLQAIIRSLATLGNFSDATDLVISGCSSGGVAVVANADHLYDLLQRAAPKATLAAFVDSGYYLNLNTEYWTKPVYKMQHIRRTLNAQCLDAQRATPWNCIVAEVAAPFVELMPLFLAQSRYDTNQLDCANISTSNVTGVNAYGAQLLTSVHAWADGTRTQSPRRGAFIDACSRHCSITTAITTLGGLNPVTAFALFLQGSLAKSVQVQPGEYPCKKCCSGTEDAMYAEAIHII